MIIFKVKCTTAAIEEDEDYYPVEAEAGESASLSAPVQTTKILDFFSPKTSKTSKLGSAKRNGKVNSVNGGTASTASSAASTASNTTVSKASKTDKKRKNSGARTGIDESKVVTNGGCMEAAEAVAEAGSEASSVGSLENGHKSPPAKKRIAEQEHDEKPVVAASTASTSSPASNSKNVSSISNFFRPISKSDFIKDSEKRTMTVKAMVHSPSEIRSASAAAAAASKAASREEEEAALKPELKLTLEEDKTTPKNKRKRRGSKYVSVKAFEVF